MGIFDPDRLPRCLSTFLLYFRYLFVFLFPIVTSPIAIINPGAVNKCAYILLWMGAYWVTGCISLYATSFLPMFLGPVMGLATSKELAKEYMPSSNILMIASMTLAAAAEHTNLHRRIAILCLRCMGFDARLIILGIMLPTWLLSMWMSNTSATLMMIIIVEAMLEKIEDVIKAKSKGRRGSENGDDEIEGEDGVVDVKIQEGKRTKMQKFGIALSLGVCYASSCGGMATLIGTSTNLVFAQMVETEYGTGTGLNFGTWVAYALPISLLIVLVTWFVLCLIYLGPRETFSCKKPVRSKPRVITPDASSIENKDSDDAYEDEEGQVEDELSLPDIVNEVIQEERVALGSVKWSEGLMMVLFGAIILLWISREPGVPGWSQFMPTYTDASGKTNAYVDDTTPAILIVFLAFILPFNNPFKKWNRPEESYKQAKARINEPLMPWSLAQAKGSWGVIILMGGGFALALILRTSGLSSVIGDALSGIGSLPVFGMVYLLSLFVSIATEVVSNTATVTILLPIIFQLCQTITINPLYISLPIVVAASCAFILPAGTPPNAIIYAKGRMRLTDMMGTGLLVNLLGQFIITICTMTYAVPLFGLNTIPDWAQQAP